METGTISYDNVGDNMTCTCGNLSHTDGFVACDENGLEMDATTEGWEGRYRCQSCGAVININQPSSPPPPVNPPGRFVQIGHGIMQGVLHVATAHSVTMARRIANALNFYKPNERGY